MKEILDNRITKIGDKWITECLNCKKQIAFSTKNKSIEMLTRGSCRNCKKDYRNIHNKDIPIYKNSNDKWCKTCSCCGKEQEYTRKDHAKQSYLGDNQCRDCVSKSKAFSNNRPVGDKMRLFNKFFKSSKSRNIKWNITLDQMFSIYTGKCSLTGWEINITHKNCTASLDRIDNSMGYSPDNIQWVHTMVNMCKNKYDEKKFIDLCKCITENTQKNR
jgi:hypothetical protein